MTKPDIYETCAARFAKEQVDRFEKSGRPEGFLKIPSEWETRLIIERLRALSTTHRHPMLTHQ